MSGHSRWHKVRQYKGAIDAKRSGLFTKMARNVTVAARQGGDPNFNFQLRMAIDRAKSVSVPKEIIERAIKKGTGELGGEQVVEAVYEALGPGKVGLIIVCQTDNTNRALSDVKHALNKNGGEISSQNSVAWNFDKLGVIYISQTDLLGKNFDELELELIDGGAKEITKDDEVVTIFTEVADYGKMLKKIEALNLKPEESGFEYIPKDTKQLTPEQEDELNTLVGVLEELDDVDKVFHNAK